MKKVVVFLAAIFVTLVVACQPKDKLFEQPVRLQGGVYLGTEATLHTTWPTGTTMPYPGLGIATSTGSAWGVSIPNNSAFWNTAYSWGNHAGLYRPVSWVPAWNDVIGKPTFAAVATSGSYNDLADKPEIIELEDALPSLSGIRLPVLTQTQINALVPVKGLLLWNDTEGCLQVYGNGVWKTIVTTN